MPEPIEDSQPSEEHGLQHRQRDAERAMPRNLHAVIDDPTHATPDEVSGYARRRDAVNNMRRAACFRLAELSRPSAEGERPKLALPTVAPSERDEAGAVPTLQDLPLQQASAAAETQIALQAPFPHPTEPTSPRVPPIAAPPSWLMQREQLGDSATTLGLLLIDYADANIRRHLDLARALLTAKSLAEAIERHDSYMKSSTRIFEEQSAELQALAAQAAEA